MFQNLTRRSFLTGSAVTMAGVCLAACGQVAVAPVESEAPAEAPQAAEPSVESEKPVVTYIWYDTGREPRKSNFEGAFAAMRAALPDIDIQIDYHPGGGLASYAEKVVAAQAAGLSWDVYWGHFSFLSQLLTAEVIEPIDPYLTVDSEISADDFYDFALDRVSGQVFGIAYFTNGKEFWYNADLIAEAGLTSPRELEAQGKWTWDAVVEMAARLTQTEGDRVTRWGFNYPYWSTGWFGHHLLAWGADWWNEDFTAPTINSPEAVAATQQALDMVIKHRVSAGRTKGREPNVGANFTKQEVATIVTGPFYVRVIEANVMQQPDPFKVEMTMLPNGPAGRKVIQAINSNYFGKDVEHPEAAWAVYKYFLSEDIQKWMAGNGGGRYTANKSFQPTVLQPYEDPAVYAASTEISVANRQIVQQSAVNRAWTKGWEALEGGQLTVKEHLDAVQHTAETALEEGGCIC
jgi:ABC-type glycerol-3-phosphate transport system substrate-binding protein